MGKWENSFQIPQKQGYQGTQSSSSILKAVLYLVKDYLLPFFQ
jgi:hypothetical protein